MQDNRGKALHAEVSSLQACDEASCIDVGAYVRFHEEAEPDSFQRGSPRKAGFIQGDGGRSHRSAPCARASRIANGKECRSAGVP